MIALHTSAAKRKEENGLTKYGASVGGRRPPPRGQRTPFKPMPKRFSASASTYLRARRSRPAA